MAVIPDDQMFAVPGAPPPEPEKLDDFFNVPQAANDTTTPSQEKVKPSKEVSTSKEGKKRKKPTKGRVNKEEMEQAKKKRVKCLVLLGFGATLTTLSLVLLIIVLLHGWTDVDFIPGMTQ